MRRLTGLEALVPPIVALSLAAASCSFTAPPVRYFEVRPGPVERQSGPLLPAVVVPDFECASAYDNLRVVLRKSPVEVATSRNLQWTTAPGRMLAQGLRVQLEGTGRFQAVQRAATPPPRYRVEGFVRAIELDEQPTLTARLALDLTVRRSGDGRVILDEAIDRSRAAGSERPADGVLALRAVYADVLTDVTTRIITAIEASEAQGDGGGDHPAARDREHTTCASRDVLAPCNDTIGSLGARAS